jgi:cell division septation protein DedD
MSELDKIQIGEMSYPVDAALALETFDAAAHGTPAQSEAAPKEPFWGVWVYASKNEGEAQQFAEDVRSNGANAGVVLTTDWSNLNTEPWHVVYIGPFSNQVDAETAQAQAVSDGYSNAYTKYSGDYQGT